MNYGLSPTLERAYSFWNDEVGDWWLCDSELRSLFIIPPETLRIRLFASTRARRDTYKVKGTALLWVDGTSYRAFETLRRWIREQGKQGRSNVGIEILE